MSRHRDLLALRVTVYFWETGFMALAPSFSLQGSEKPQRLPYATLILGLSKPFTVDTGSGTLESRALLLSPAVPRRAVTADGSNIVLFNLFVATQEYVALAPLLHQSKMCELDPGIVAPLTSTFSDASSGSLEPSAVRALVHRTIFLYTGRQVKDQQLDPRISHVLDRIRQCPMSETSLTALANTVHLSNSRLRHLFLEQTGCSISDYKRWSAVLKAGWLSSWGKSLAASAGAVGFHDSAHFNRAFKEAFGLNPSAISDLSNIRMVRCEWD